VFLLTEVILRTVVLGERQVPSVRDHLDKVMLHIKSGETS
jgi:hypothetical protein